MGWNPFTCLSIFTIRGAKFGHPTEIVFSDPCPWSSDSDISEAVHSRWPPVEANQGATFFPMRITKEAGKAVVALPDEYITCRQSLPLPVPQRHSVSPLFDIFDNHEQALYAWDKALVEGKLRRGGILLHFDTHSDMMGVCKSGCFHDGDWITTAIADGTVSEVYWVLPPWSKERPDRFQWTAPWININNHGNQKDFISFVKDGKATFSRSDGAREVWLHKVTFDQLPSFEHGTNLYLDIDFDYFSNSGWKTHGGKPFAEFNPVEEELMCALSEFFRKLDAHGIHPQFITLARSPYFTNEEDIPVIERAFRERYGCEHDMVKRLPADGGRFMLEILRALAREEKNLECGPSDIASMILFLDGDGFDPVTTAYRYRMAGQYSDVLPLFLGVLAEHPDLLPKEIFDLIQLYLQSRIGPRYVSSEIEGFYRDVINALDASGGIGCITRPLDETKLQR